MDPFPICDLAELRLATQLAETYIEYLEPPYGGPSEMEFVPPADMLQIAKALILASRRLRLAA